MKLRSLLQDVSFGEDVADFDEHLAQYFVETSSFQDVIADRADLILGEKGSGKSAIFRQLADPNADIPELNQTDILPAFNTHGSIVFRRLAQHPRMPEEALRFAWFTYLVALVGNHLISQYASVLNLRKLKKLLKAAGLHVGSPSPTGVWARIDQILESLAQRVELDGELRIAGGKLPVEARAKGKILPGRRRHEQVDIEELLFECDALLAQVDRRCWIIFDRLDEAFQHNQEVERNALRGLLRAYLDLASYQLRLKAKLFLRIDILDRVTKLDGFVNATHLRVHRLKWDRDGVLDLIARRINSSATAREFFQFNEESLRNRTGRLEICTSILPSKVEHQDIMGWIEQSTIDGNGALNPRNVVSLLRLARTRQLEECDRDDPDYRLNWPPISRQALRSGHAALSKERLEDTVLAEYPTLRPTIDALRGKASRFSHSQLGSALGLSESSSEFDETLLALRYSGVIGGTNKYMLVVPPLYRPALRSLLARNPTADGLSFEEQEELAKIADKACADAIESRAVQFIYDVDNLQIDYISSRVKGNYPTLYTKVVRSGNTTFKRLMVRLPRDSDAPKAEDLLPQDGKSEGEAIDPLEIPALVEQLRSDTLEHGSSQIVCISHPMSAAQRMAVEDYVRATRQDEDRVNLIAYATDRDGCELVAFANDLIGRTLSMQDERLESNVQEAETIRAYVGAMCELALQRDLKVHFRPMRVRMIVCALKKIETFPGLTYELFDRNRGVVQIVVKRQ